MSPLAASLVFVIIAIVVSIVRHVFFQGPTLNAGDDINISLTKLHTITLQQHQKNKNPYNSLYEAYYRPQEKNGPSFPLPYNSFVLKKSILNNEGVYICNEKFTAIFEEKTSCEGLDSLCKWKTTISVYRLPYLRKQEEKTLEIDGRVLRNQNVKNQIKCIKKQLSHANYRYELNFVVLHRSKQSKKGAGWTMNSLIIEEQQQGWRKNGSFSIKMRKWNLKNVFHYPILYSFDDKCLSYIAQQQPWLIYFNCGLNWSTFNILNPKVQNTLFARFNSSYYQASFSSTHHVNPLFLQLFKSTLKLYSVPETCTGACTLRELKEEKILVTYVFQISNSPIKFGNTIAQITIAISQKGQGKQNEALVSFNIISNEINPQKRVFIDCNINTKQYKFIKGLYTYQLGLQTGQDHTVASIDKHSLICVCSYNYVDSLRVIQIGDLLNNMNLAGIPTQLLVRTKQQIEQLKLQNTMMKKEKSKEVYKQQEDESWFDFFDFVYDFEEDPAQKQPQVALQGSPLERPIVSKDQEDIEIQKKQKKAKKNPKKQEKKRGTKKQKRYIKGEQKISEGAVGDRIEQLAENFYYIGHDKAKEAEIQIIQIPMPFTLSSQSKLKVLNGDLQLPLIYIETNKKFLLTYQQKQNQDDDLNKTKATQYTYKYSQLGTIKSYERYFAFNESQGNQSSRRKEELDIDLFLLQVLQYNSDILNQVKSITIVDARYDQFTPKLSKLKGLIKPYRKQVIVVWGWGIEVYEMNWDRKNKKNQFAQLQVKLNSNYEGIQMLALIPFIQLFATVFCLFQTLISTR